ncbi:acyl carrier protein [Gallibacterium salpingitidis]|uniref:Acyl carrier protein n=1 Tax=Gallibacterium salpingitidis TaxID=505341 RepID=A0A1A7PZ85_9PAST|nr:acyl carrier protein [Gallibacterium salpingitidis]OBW96442.1 acyl carrier protein [Gallibacterium salpingitidis]OBX06465.1 acyl carrier protein [Gallibacterium salpingitidis]OBX08908.1 acyl carrier protein [Gallibacterium salpingitidis]WKS99404.1 acyl carrier protein [Gallibacterium salpingitidis]
MEKNEIFVQVKTFLEELFDIDPDTVTLESHIAEDLELDSIDAVDLIVHLQNKLKKRVSPEEFKNVRTISDIVDVIYKLQ